MNTKKDKKSAARRVKKPSRASRTSRPAPERAEEVLLIRRIQCKDARAPQQLLDRYASWAQNLARKYHAIFPTVGIPELIAEANRGIIEAAGRFDPERNVKFSTYAWYWILKDIQEYISESVSLVGMPARSQQQLRRIVRSMNEELKKGKEPSLEKVSRKLGIDIAVIQERLADRRNLITPVSLDKYLDDEAREETVGDMVADKSLAAIPEALEQSDRAQELLAAITSLAPLEQEIIKWRFGFTDHAAHTLSDIARKLKITPSRAKDIESVAMQKLKRTLQSEDFGEI